MTMNVIYRDNTSAMKLEENGKASSGKCTQHFNIKYFYITDLIERKKERKKESTDIVLSSGCSDCRLHDKTIGWNKIYSFS